MKWQNILSKRELETVNRVRDGSNLHLNLLATEAIRKMANLLDEMEKEGIEIEYYQEQVEKAVKYG